MEQIDVPCRRQPQRLQKPIISEDGDSLTLQFRIGEIQSEMSKSDPNSLMLSYTRTMMSFVLFQREPKRIAIIGLGGGSIPKWCFHQLPTTDITVSEINPMVISLRDEFHIPPDNDRFRVLCQDGADYVAHTEDSPDVILVDGFDADGQPPQLCSQKFYNDCFRALAPEGLLVVNLCDPRDPQFLERIRQSFEGRVLMAVPRVDGENKVVFARKGSNTWMKEEPKDELSLRSLAILRNSMPEATRPSSPLSVNG